MRHSWELNTISRFALDHILCLHFPSLCYLIYIHPVVTFLLFVAHLQSEPLLQPYIYRPGNGPLSVPQPDLFPGGRSSSSSQRWQGALALVGHGSGASRYTVYP